MDAATADDLSPGRRLVSHYELGEACGYLLKTAGTPISVPVLSGRLYASASGWILLSVPNALVRGLFDALDVPGAELPPGPNGFSAHISVMNKDEVASIGGVDKITERGHTFRYQIGPIQTVEPAGWREMSRVWFVSVKSRDLESLRKSYGLSALPDEGRKALHCSIAVRRKHVLRENEVAKAAGHVSDWERPFGDGRVLLQPPAPRGPAGEYCPHCDARMERGDDGRCNRCGKDWPEEKAAAYAGNTDYCQHCLWWRKRHEDGTCQTCGKPTKGGGWSENTLRAQKAAEALQLALGE